MAAVLKLFIRNLTPSINAHLLKQSIYISSQSNLKRQPSAFKEVARNKKNKMSSDKRSVPDLKIYKPTGSLQKLELQRIMPVKKTQRLISKPQNSRDFEKKNRKLVAVVF